MTLGRHWDTLTHVSPVEVTRNRCASGMVFLVTLFFSPVPVLVGRACWSPWKQPCAWSKQLVCPLVDIVCPHVCRKTVHSASLKWLSSAMAILQILIWFLAVYLVRKQNFESVATTVTSLSTSWCCPSMIYAIFFCDDYNLLLPVVWFSAVCHVDTHGWTMITCNSWQQELLMYGEDIDLLPYILVCSVFSVWYAKHPPVAFVFKDLDSSLQLSSDHHPTLSSIEQNWNVL